jgi:hypothetical protein
MPGRATRGCNVSYLSRGKSVVQAKFLEGLRLEEIELELSQRFRRQRVNLLLDFEDFQTPSFSMRPEG